MLKSKLAFVRISDIHCIPMCISVIIATKCHNSFELASGKIVGLLQSDQYLIELVIIRVCDPLSFLVSSCQIGRRNPDGLVLVLARLPCQVPHRDSMAPPKLTRNAPISIRQECLIHKNTQDLLGAI